MNYRILISGLLVGAFLSGCSPEEPKSTKASAEDKRFAQEFLHTMAASDAESGDHESARALTKVADRMAADQPVANAHMVSLNTSSKKYHESGCRYYDCRNCVTVEMTEAERQGGIPCKRCH